MTSLKTHNLALQFSSLSIQPPQTADPSNISTLANQFLFLQVKPPEHPEKRLFKQQVTAWNHLSSMPNGALKLVPAGRFAPNTTPRLLQKVDAFQANYLSQYQHTERLESSHRVVQTLDLDSTLPKHRAPSARSFLDWINLESGATKPLQSTIELEVTKIPIKKAFSRMDAALSWVKKPLQWLQNAKHLPTDAFASLPSHTKTLMKETFKGSPLKEGNVLGKGFFGSVSVTSLGSNSYAHKKPFGKELEKSTTTLQNEACVYMTLPKHPHIVTLEGANSNGLLLSLIHGTTFQKVLKNPDITSRQFITYLLHITEALLHLHVHGYTYKDLKPENVLVDTNTQTAYLCDLGLASKSEQDGISAGSPYFMAPELHDPATIKQKKISQKVDSWSFGILLYEQLTGCLPFPRKKEEDGSLESIENYKKRKKELYLKPASSDHLFSRLPPEGKERLEKFEVKQPHSIFGKLYCKPLLQSLILDCLHGDPEKRLSMKKIHNRLMECLKHS